MPVISMEKTEKYSFCSTSEQFLQLYLCGLCNGTATLKNKSNVDV